jgi:hypothetical protein
MAEVGSACNFAIGRDRTGLLALHQAECERQALESDGEGSQDAKLDDADIAEMGERSLVEALC